MKRGFASLVLGVVVVAAACTGASSPSPSAATSVAPSSSAAGSASASPSTAASVAPVAGGLLDKVIKAGTIKVSTDPNYAPQSIQKPDGTFEGFDIDVATEIAKRMGNLKVEFVTPDWSVITAGGWSGRWDMSVGSMTITGPRQKVLDFSPPYYFTPAQMAASQASGITTLDGLAGKTVCVGESTTYLDWLNGQLDLGSYSSTAKTPPAGVKAVTQKTDQQCPQLWAAGRNDFEGWLSSSSTVQAAIDAKQPVVKVGDPVFYEPLGVAVDKSGPNDSDFVAQLKTIVDGMHADGTLKTLSMKWFKTDLSEGPTL